MNKLRDTELIITNSGRIYHLNLKKEEIADDIILVGDPNRVQQISNKFEKIDFKITHREFITHTGYYNNKKISVISSGIGTDNIDIVINELDALANINIDPKELKYADIGAGSGYFVSALRGVGLINSVGYEVSKSQVSFGNLMIGQPLLNKIDIENKHVLVIASGGNVDKNVFENCLKTIPI